MALLVDTSQFDVADRAEALHRVLTSASAPHDLTFLGPRDQVRARLEHWQLGSSVSLLQQESSGIAHTRDETHAGLEGPERVVFVVHDGGPGSHVREGKIQTLERGALYVTDLNSEYSYRRPGHGMARIAMIERAALGLPVEAIQAAAGRLITSPLYNLLRSHIAGLCKGADRISTTSQAADVGDATARLAASLLQTTSEPIGLAGRGALMDYLIDRIMLFVELNFADHDLSADRIAAEHNISTRYLFKLWSGQPQTLQETIMTVRLEAARRRLMTSPPITVASVAHRCGFPDASHFSRRFRQTYGLSPSQWRLSDYGA